MSNIQQRDVENGIYPQLQQRPQTRRQDTVDMEEIPLNNLQQEPEERRKIRHVFERVSTFLLLFVLNKTKMKLKDNNNGLSLLKEIFIRAYIYIFIHFMIHSFVVSLCVFFIGGRALYLLHDFSFAQCNSSHVFNHLFINEISFGYEIFS